MKINRLWTFRYSVTELRNENILQGLLTSRHTVGLSPPMSCTYETLIGEHTNKLAQAGSSTQVIRNHRTALRKWLDGQKMSEQNFVGPEFDENFESAVLLHLEYCGLNTRSAADRRSILRSWKFSFDNMLKGKDAKPQRERRSAKSPPSYLAPFEQTLRAALAEKKLSPKVAARLSGTSISAMGRWTRGALPNSRSIANFSALENLLELPAGRLLNAFKESLAQQQPAYPNEYRRTLGARVKSKYRLPLRECSSSLLAEWQDLLRYKTSPTSGDLLRSPKGRWSTVNAAFSAIPQVPHLMVGTQVVPTADVQWGQFMGFLGYLRLPVTQGGLGRSLEEVQTISWLVVPEVAEGYLNFMMNRAGGKRHTGMSSFCAFVCSLTNPKHGYLTQQPQLLSALPADVVGSRRWENLCSLAHSTALAWKRDCTDKSRSPAETIQYFLDHDKPLQPIVDAMRALRDAGDRCVNNSREELLARRDELILALFLANPLRLQNWMTMRYVSDNSGDIRRRGDGSWRLQLNGNRFKNRSTKARETYSVGIAKWVTPLFDEYVHRVRPALMKEVQVAHEVLLVTDEGKPMTYLGRRVFELTKRHVPKSGGIGPQAFRHLVATSWLMEFPNDFVTVAELLNDTLDVVMRNYSHMKKDVAFSRHDGFVQSLIDRRRD